MTEIEWVRREIDKELSRPRGWRRNLDIVAFGALLITQVVIIYLLLA